jgi:2-keto-4-pentenoate hydratase/2-oxohepta-3-ene-1,7-dioic acid hydratase in catechol pathway
MNKITCDGKSFTPSKLICVGKNYVDHIAEMGGGGRPEKPTIFIKPNSAIAFEIEELILPQGLGLVHHEVELCFVMGRNGQIAGYAVGLDLTLRNLQAKVKEQGMPWALAKGFDSSAPLGKFLPANQIDDPCALDISLSVNGKMRQQSNTREMIFSPQEILAYASKYMTIEEGDVFMCGTPSGVGELEDDDLVKAIILGLPELEFVVKRR